MAVLGYEAVRQALADPGLSNSLDNLNPALAEAGPWVLAERVMGLDAICCVPTRRPMPGCAGW
jgi:hypothetical protein